jgi:O-antigen/teichoic acid export membrane protein
LLLFNCFVFTTVISFALALVFYWFRETVAVIILENGDFVHIVEVYALILFFQSLSDFLLTFIRQEEKGMFFVVISWGRFVFSVGFILYGLIYLKIGVLALIYGNLIGAVFTVLCTLPIFWKYSSHKISFSLLGSPLKYGYPRILNGISMMLIESGDRYVLKIFTSLSTVGLYSFGYFFAGIISSVLNMPMKQAIFPMAFKMEDEPEQQKDFLRKGCNYYYIIGMFLCLFLSVYSREMIEIMARKKEFWASSIIVPMVAFSYLQHGLGTLFDWGLMMTKKSFCVSRNVFIAAVVNIGLNFILIPYWDMLGAAFATIVSYIVWNWLKLYYSAKYYDLHFDLRRLGYISAVGIGLYLVSLLVANTSYMPLNIVIKFLVLLAYPIIFFLTGFFTPDEKEYIKKKLSGSIGKIGIPVSIS